MHPNLQEIEPVPKLINHVLNAQGFGPLSGGFQAKSIAVANF
jgi:hypothetical protein